MKQFFKNNVIGFILGAIIFTIVGVYASSTITASDIAYKNTTVDLALDNLYTSVDNLFPTFYDVAFAGKDQTSSTSGVTASVSAVPGKYVVIITIASVQGSSTIPAYDQTSALANLTGCNTKSVITYQTNGEYKDDKAVYPAANNIPAYSTYWSIVYSCTVDSTSTITYTQGATTNDKNMSLLLLKY